jgi:hypothetical protein
LTVKVSVKIVLVVLRYRVCSPGRPRFSWRKLSCSVSVIQPAFRTGVGRRVVGGLLGGQTCLESWAGAGQAGLDGLEGEHPALDPGAARFGVGGLLLRWAHPDDAVPLAGRDRRRRSPVHLIGVADPLARPPGGLGELERVCLRPLADLRILGAGARQDAEEPPVVGVDVAHLLAGGELAVGDVEKPGAADQLDEPVPGGDVGLIIVGVAVQQAVRERDGPVGWDRQRQHELLQVGAMVLGVPQCRRDGRLAGTRTTVRRRVVAVHRDRRRVIVQLRAVDLKLLDHAEHQLRQQRRAVSIEQLVQCAPDAVVVEQGALARGEAQQPGVIALGPLRQAVERLARDAQVGHQHPDRHRRAQHHALIARWQVALQQPPQSDPRKEVVDDRQRPQALRGELEWLLRSVGHAGLLASVQYLRYRSSR